MNITIEHEKREVLDIWPADEDMLQNLPLVVCTSGEGFYVAGNREQAAEAAYKEYKDWADYAPEDFLYFIGPETIAFWHFGLKAKPKDFPWEEEFSSLEEWLEWVRAHPEIIHGAELEGLFAERSHLELEVEEADQELIDKLGFRPTVAYLMGTHFQAPGKVFGPPGSTATPQQERKE